MDFMTYVTSFVLLKLSQGIQIISDTREGGGVVQVLMNIFVVFNSDFMAVISKKPCCR